MSLALYLDLSQKSLDVLQLKDAHVIKLALKLMQPRAHCVILDSLKVIPPTSCSLIYLYNVAIYVHSDFSYISDIYKTCPMNIGNFNVWQNLPYLALYI